jgi:hypothetical protein
MYFVKIQKKEFNFIVNQCIHISKAYLTPYMAIDAL